MVLLTCLVACFFKRGSLPNTVPSVRVIETGEGASMTSSS